MNLFVNALTLCKHFYIDQKLLEEYMEADILVVTSKVKKFIKEKGEMNTSAETVDILSKAIERLCSKGIESAKADGRKTVMARDIIIDHI
jgi:histone H3/H4